MFAVVFLGAQKEELHWLLSVGGDGYLRGQRNTFGGFNLSDSSTGL